MLHSFRILDASVARDHADGREFIDVKVHVTCDEGEVDLGERSFGFPLDTTEEAIRAELAKVMSTMDADAEAHAANAEQDALRDLAQETVAALKQNP